MAATSGIVTEFTFRLAPVGQVLGGVLMLPATHEVVRGYLDYSIAAPDDLTTISNLMFAPPAPFVPEDRVGDAGAGHLPGLDGQPRGRRAGACAATGTGEPVADAVSPMPYPAIYDFTAAFAEPHAASIRMMFADDLSDEAIDAMLAALAHPSSPYGLIHLRGLGGAYGRVPNDATAFAHRDRRYFVAVINVWLDASEDAATHEAWTDVALGRSCGRKARASTSTSWKTKAWTACGRPIRGPPTTGSPRSSGGTTRTTSSASTRTSRHGSDGALARGQAPSGRGPTLPRVEEQIEQDEATPMDSHEKTPTSHVSRVTRRTLLRRAGIGSLAAGLAVAQGSRTLAFGEQPAPVLPATRHAVAAAQTLHIDVVDDRPVPPEVSVPVGTAVAWINRGADLRVIAALDGSFDSGQIAPGGVFTHHFAKRGSYRYVCEHHAMQGITGRIDVK